MGLFGGKSKSVATSTNTTTTTTIDQSKTISGTVGDLSKNNIITSGDVSTIGYTADDTKSILDTVLQQIDRVVGDLKEVTGTAITQTADAYAGANDSILQSQSETKTFLRSLQPFALYAAVAAVAYFIFRK